MNKIVIQHQQLNQVEPTAEEWQSWLGQKTGQYFIEMLNNKMADIQDDWANGIFTDVSADTTFQLNANGLGRLEAYGDIIITLEELKDGSSEDEDEGEGEETPN